MTLARLLRIQLAIELLLYAALGAMLTHLRGWTVGETAALALCSFFGVRAWLISVTFAVAWLARSARPPQQRIGALVALSLWLRECWAFVVLFAVVQPFERVFARANRAPPRGGLPILLVHGYQCNRALWHRFQRKLEARGLAVWSVDLGPPLASIDMHARALDRHIEALLEASGASRVTIITHSMGGLAARACLAEYGTQRIAKLITIGTPHAGSALARIGWGECGRQMRPGDAWLERLAQRWKPDASCDATSIYSVHDNFVMPQENQRLPGAENVALIGLGHLSMLDAPEVFDAVLRALPEG